LVFRYLRQQNNAQTLRHIERGNYADDDLILVKVPVLLPYASNWSDYERYDGEIEWGGIHYNYVKRKILNDTLYLLCLPDMKRTSLADARDQYTRNVNSDAGTPQKSSDSSAKVTVLPRASSLPNNFSATGAESTMEDLSFNAVAVLPYLSG